jgi:hypothetical protein
MSERKRTLEQAKAMEEVRIGMAQVREAIAEEMPWLSADEVSEVVDKELVTAAREMDELETQA